MLKNSINALLKAKKNIVSSRVAPELSRFAISIPSSNVRHNVGNEIQDRRAELMDVQMEKLRFKPTELLEYYEKCRKEGISPSLLSLNCLIEAYLKKGETKELFSLLQRMEEDSRIAPDIKTFEIILSDLLRKKKSEAVLHELFSLMQDTYEIKPSSQIYLSMVLFYIRYEKIPQKALNYYKALKENGLNADHIARLLKSAFTCSSGRYNTELVWYFLKEAEQENILLPLDVWESLGLNAIYADDLVVAEKSFHKLIQVYDEESLSGYLLEEYMLFAAKAGNMSILRSALHKLLSTKSLRVTKQHLYLFIHCFIRRNEGDLVSLNTSLKLLKECNYEIDYQLRQKVVDELSKKDDWPIIENMTETLQACLIEAKNDLSTLEQYIATESLAISNAVLTVKLKNGMFKEALDMLNSSLRFTANDETWFIVCKYLIESNKLEHLALVLHYVKEISSAKYLNLLKPMCPEKLDAISPQDRIKNKVHKLICLYP